MIASSDQAEANTSNLDPASKGFVACIVTSNRDASIGAL